MTKSRTNLSALPTAVYRTLVVHPATGAKHALSEKAIPLTNSCDSNSTNAVNFSSARTMKRFPSPRCAPATKIVLPLESTAETQPQLQSASLRKALEFRKGRGND